MLWHFTCFVNIKSRNIKMIVISRIVIPLALPVVAVADPGTGAAEAKPVDVHQCTSIP